MLRHDWTIPEIRALYTQPFPDLIYQAHRAHRAHFDPAEVQRSTLLSIKTGGCPEDCAYCPQSAHHSTGIQEHSVLPLDFVLDKARQAKAEGSTRFCMGAAWREIPDGNQFHAVLELVRAVHNLGLEVCCTLGMLTDSQARRLKEAGCTTYNHNLDTSPEFYGRIISTRTYQERLDTLKRVRDAGMTICCGGIIGMGESLDDRFSLLAQLANQDPHPESVPINALQPVDGTPLAGAGGGEPLDSIDFVRTIATARIIMPSSYVRLSAGRANMSDEAQALCFLAGANSIFAGEKLLTQPNAPQSRDHALMTKLGMHFREISSPLPAPAADGFHAHACDHERH